MANSNKQARKIETTKVTLSIIAVLLILATITVGIIGYFSQGFKNWDTESWGDKPGNAASIVDGDGNDLSDPDKVYPMPSTLAFNSDALAASNGQGVSVTLNATVYPVDAENKAVDWTVEWGFGAVNATNSVSDYITVNPQFDGSTTVSVTCHKAFGNDKIIITVTTRVGGYHDSCNVSFVGVPSNLKVNTDGTSTEHDNGWNKDIIMLDKGNEYAFNVSLDNVFGFINTGITPTYSIEVSGVGTFNLNRKTVDQGSEILNDTVEVSMTSTVNLGINGDKSWRILDKIMFVTLEGNSININAFGSALSGYSYKESYNANRTSYSELKFSSYKDENKKPYLQIKITETNTNLSATINVRIDSSSVTGVRLDQTLLEF